MKRAAMLVLDNEGRKDFSIRKIGSYFGIHYSTLSRSISKIKKLRQVGNIIEMPRCGYAKIRKVFTETEEDILVQYIIRSSDIMFGLDPISVRKLAYQCAVLHEIKMPTSWTEIGQAGVEWLKLFLKRHGGLSIRQPEATSLARATSFNRTNVTLFFDKLSNVLSRHQLMLRRYGIWMKLVLQQFFVQEKFLHKRCKTSGRDYFCRTRRNVAVNAQGNAVPPLFIFPRKSLKLFYPRWSTRCIGVANGSGWMQENSFNIFIQHFIKHAKPSKDSPVILLLDNNHSSHLSCQALNLCKENGIIMLSFPPHCSHKLQPLDLTVFGPFKSFAVLVLVRARLFKCCQSENITSGFSSAGIYPFNPIIFGDADFAPAFVTDRPEPSIGNVGEEGAIPPVPASANNNVAVKITTEANTSQNKIELGKENVSEPSTSNHVQRPSTPTTFSPEGKKTKENRYLNRYPEKEVLENEQKLRAEKQKKIALSKQNKKAPKRAEVRKLLADSSDEEPLKISSDEDETNCLVCSDIYDKENESQDWLQCTQCKMWAHALCAKNDPFYVCINCTSEYSDQSE
ncbi:hypothetical protein NQ318_005134 [Aromia moschata]|uniref:DDE-1 domain-containing protein n=1 Tax=Aromia moschata TaxID=1265417 RepID=A0AAV8XZM8_9CUCU|nr:hypothetical protein NQ318_005134 [Aromia moschata]